MAAAADVFTNPIDFVEFIRLDEKNKAVKEIIKQMNDIGRIHYSGGGSGYIAYGDDALTSAQLDEIRAQFKIHTDKDMDHESLPSMMGHSGLLEIAALPTIKIHDPIEVFKTIPAVKPKFDSVMVSRTLPGTFPTKAAAEAEAARLGLTEFYADRTGSGGTWKLSKSETVNIVDSKGLQSGSPALISKKGAAEIAKDGRFFVIDIAPGDHSEDEAKPAEIYLRIRSATAKKETKAKPSAKAAKESKTGCGGAGVSAGCSAKTKKRTGGGRRTRRKRYY